jgi:hypothetical protein
LKRKAAVWAAVRIFSIHGKNSLFSVQVYCKPGCISLFIEVKLQMTDPVSDYLGQLSYDQLCQVEKRIESIAKQKQSKYLAAVKQPQPDVNGSFKMPLSPGYNSTEQLAESLGLDISGLLKEAKAWSR